MQQELEDRFLSSIKTSEDYSSSVLSGIDSDSFLFRKEHFQFLSQYYYKYKTIPPKEIFEGHFDDFKIVGGITSEEKRFLVDELLKKKAYRQACEIITTASGNLTKDVYGSIDLMISKLNSIRQPFSYSRNLTDKNAEVRFGQLLERKKLIDEFGAIGIKTGLSVFDSKLYGLMPGNLVAIIARLGKGKSWLAEYIACNAYLDGNRVAYLSPEMTVFENELRWDTIMGALLEYKFPNSDLLCGKSDEAKYKEFLKRVSTRSDWLTVDSEKGRPFNLRSIHAITEEFSPDLLVIDGFLLIDIGGDRSYTKMLDVAMDLKNLAQSRKMVVLATAQALRSAADQETPDVTQIYGGDALAFASNALIMLGDDPDKPNIRYVTLPKSRMTKGDNRKITLNFDVNVGDIGI